MTPKRERRLAGRRLHFDGRAWSILYLDATTRVRFPTAGFGRILEALRAGTIVLQTDPGDIAAQPAPTNRQNAVREWLLVDATIAGAEAQGTLPRDAVDPLRRRLAVLTDYLLGDQGLASGLALSGGLTGRSTVPTESAGGRAAGGT